MVYLREQLLLLLQEVPAYRFGFNLKPFSGATTDEKGDTEDK